MPIVALIFISMTLVASLFLFRVVFRVNSYARSEPSIQISAFTPKDTYHPDGDVLLDVSVYASRSVANVSLVYGVNGSLRRKGVNLSFGMNQFELLYELNNLTAGKYNLTVSAVHSGRSVSTTVPITVQ